MERTHVARHARLATMLVVTGVLTACGGGGGEEEPEGYAGADASGIWFGTWDIDSGPQDEPVLLIARGNTEIYLDGDMQLLVGEAQTNNSAFSATAMGYAYSHAFAPGTVFSLSGTVNAGVTLSGAHSRASESGTFSLGYDPVLSDMNASMSIIDGVYPLSMWIRDGSYNGNISIAQNGTMTGSDGGCTLNGNVSVLDSSSNIYRWTAVVNGCVVNGSASGIGFSVDDPDISGFYFVGTVNGNAMYLAGFNDTGVTAMELRDSPALRSPALRTVLERFGKLP
jgi:hypothetical protein